MEAMLEKNNFGKRIRSMLVVDFRRMFTTSFIYIMLGICMVIPVLILVMTDMNSGEGTGAFYSAWQLIGALPGAAGGGMDMSAMMNINMLYFAIAIVVSVFVSADFRSGYAKNLFTVRAKKSDYVVSKILVCFVASALVLIAYFVGNILGSAIAGLSFEMTGFTFINLACCMLSKILMLPIFVALYLCMSVIGKQKTWLSMICSFVVCMFLFMMVPMISPLNSTFINVIMCLAGGLIFSIALGAASNIILKKTSLA